ncbi:MAG: SDR family oxidoreductase [Anaerolineae bacterium]
MKTALIWGASGGIGRALLKQLAGDGWAVVAVAREPNGIEELTPHVIEADISSAYEVELAVTTAAQLVDEVNLWVYAAGDITSGKVSDLSAAEWQRLLDANLTGAFLATHFSLPLLATDSHLFYLGAINERLRLPGLSAYAAAKAGLEAFAEALGKEERKRRVTVVRPGAVDTRFWDKVPLKLPKNALSAADVAAAITTAFSQKQTGLLDIQPA